MAKVGHLTVEVRPTVTLDSAVACAMMLNLFLAENEGYRLEVGDDGKWHLTDKPFVPATGGIVDGCLVAPSNLTDAECKRIAIAIEKAYKDKS